MNYRSALIEYLSELSGLPKYDEVEITFEERDKLDFHPPLWVKLDGEELQVSQAFKKGGIKVLEVRICSSNSKFIGKSFPIDYKFDKMFYKKHRTIDDFGIGYKVKKNAYKYCESGGWYSMQDIIIVNNKEFLNI